MSSNAYRGGYLLLVDDEPTIQSKNKEILQQRGYDIKQAFNIAQAQAIISEEMPNAVVLDVRLPDGSGIDFLRDFRKVSNAPVMMVSALGTPNEIINGLEAGADDYLVKPYDVEIFLVRLTVLMRRAMTIPDVLNVGNIKINLASGKAFVNNEDMNLTQKELALLQQFVQHPEEILNTESLYLKVWGHNMLKQDTALKVAISKLRTKLNNSGYTIVAFRGEGYSFERE
ncbi:MAG: response regulator transcription factor [Defluviitaleaceae bacterium]|nr:response regulator transcription factor [Defluviitaleaceae bacterium]